MSDGHGCAAAHVLFRPQACSPRRDGVVVRMLDDDEHFRALSALIDED